MSEVKEFDIKWTMVVDLDKCTGCGACTRIGCPAISKDADGKACIDPSLCNGCPQCAQYCMFDAIHEEA